MRGCARWRTAGQTWSTRRWSRVTTRCAYRVGGRRTSRATSPRSKRSRRARTRRGPAEQPRRRRLRGSHVVSRHRRQGRDLAAGIGPCRPLHRLVGRTRPRSGVPCTRRRQLRSPLDQRRSLLAQSGRGLARRVACPAAGERTGRPAMRTSPGPTAPTRDRRRPAPGRRVTCRRLASSARGQRPRRGRCPQTSRQSICSPCSGSRSSRRGGSYPPPT